MVKPQQKNKFELFGPPRNRSAVVLHVDLGGIYHGQEILYTQRLFVCISVSVQGFQIVCGLSRLSLLVVVPSN